VIQSVNLLPASGAPVVNVDGATLTVVPYTIRKLTATFPSSLGISGQNPLTGVYGAGVNGTGATNSCTGCPSGTGGLFRGGGTSDDNRYGGGGVWAFPGSTGGIGLYVGSNGSGVNPEAAEFDGDIYVLGNLSKLGGSFQIDHPLDPANKYLYHSFVESPDMMNIYKMATSPPMARARRPSPCPIGSER